MSDNLVEAIYAGLVVIVCLYIGILISSKLSVRG
jgi:hypothetical protein